MQLMANMAGGGAAAWSKGVWSNLPAFNPSYTYTQNIPAGYSAGDLLVCYAGGHQFTTLEQETVTDNLNDGVVWTSGQRAVIAIDGGVNQLGGRLWYKKIGATFTGGTRSVTVEFPSGGTDPASQCQCMVGMFKRGDPTKSITRENNVQVVSSTPVALVNHAAITNTQEKLCVVAIVNARDRSPILLAPAGWVLGVNNAQENQANTWSLTIWERITSGADTGNADMNFMNGDGASAFISPLGGYRTPT